MKDKCELCKFAKVQLLEDLSDYDFDKNLLCELAGVGVEDDFWCNEFIVSDEILRDMIVWR